MSNYVKTTDFAAKDALPSGNPNKIAQGTQVDTEFNNIAVAIATKQDTSARGQADGYAALDGSGDVPDGQIPPTIPRTSSANTFTGIQTISSAAPQLIFNETDAPANNRRYDFIADGEGFFGRLLSDGGTPSVWLQVDRTANTVDQVLFNTAVLSLNGLSVRDASLFNAGSLLASVVPQAAVTQHQAALSISESQIGNGTIYTRVADAETVSGNWNFSNGLRSFGNSVYHAGNDGAGSGLDADQLDGYHASESAASATVAARNSSGYLFANYFNTGSAYNDGTVPTHIYGGNSDGYIRGAALSTVGPALSPYVTGRNLSGKVGTVKVLSTSAPSGGYADGDIWYQY